MGKRRGSGEGTIYRRGDGRWSAVIHEGWLPGGDRKRRWVYRATRAEVVKALQEAQRLQRQGIALPPDRLTVGEYLDSWLSEIAKPTLRPSTFTSYESIVRRHLKPALGRVPLAKLEPDHVVRLMATKREQDLASRTVIYVVAVLRAALQEALRTGKVVRNVAAVVRKPKLARKPVEPFDIEQTQRLLAAARATHLDAFLTLGTHSGLRLGEMLALRWSDVDLGLRRLRVAHTLWRPRGGGWRLTEPKSERSRRSLSLSSPMVDALTAQRARQAEMRLAAGSAWADHDFVFTTDGGEPLEARNVRRAFYRLLAQCGLPRKRLHDLRHLTASLMIATGAHPRAIMEQLGHSQIGLTMNTYGHLLPDVLREQADAVAALLSESDSTPAVVNAVVKTPIQASVTPLDYRRPKKNPRENGGFPSGPPRPRTADPLIKSQIICRSLGVAQSSSYPLAS